jgi:hypothetical protein
MKTMTKKTKSSSTKLAARTMNDLRAQASDARRALVGLGARAVHQVEKHPVGAVAGAFATGMAVAKLVGRG